jgi:hypothetical protein
MNKESVKDYKTVHIKHARVKPLDLWDIEGKRTSCVATLVAQLPREEETNSRRETAERRSGCPPRLEPTPQTGRRAMG